MNDLAVLMARQQAATRIVGITAAQRAVVRNLIARGIRLGWDDDVLQARIKEKVGLDARDAQAVENLRTKMLANGLGAGDISREARIYADRLRSARALKIARYETQKALLDAQRALWTQQQEDGDLSRYAVRIWRLHKDERLCPICKPMNGRRASLKAGSMYEVKGIGAVEGPPVHPNCRCHEELSDQGVAKSFGFSDLWGPEIEKGDKVGHPFRGNQWTKRGLKKIAASRFLHHFGAAFPPDSKFKNHVTHYSLPEARQMKPFIMEGGKVGLMVHDHGDGRVEATALFNNGGPKGAGTRALREAMERHGVNYVECYGPHLNEVYEEAGFRVLDRTPFNPEYAAPDWDYAEFDHPDYFTMTWDGTMTIAKKDKKTDEPDWAAMVDRGIARGDAKLTEEQKKVRDNLVAQALTQS